jgi:hypothetical protein
LYHTVTRIGAIILDDVCVTFDQTPLCRPWEFWIADFMGSRLEA